MTTRIRKVITAIDFAGNAFSEIHSETQVGDRWYPNDPVSLDNAGPEAAAWQALYGATQAAQIAALTAERDAAIAALQPLQSEIDRLTALIPPPDDPNGVPSVITCVQGRLALLQAGLLDAVESSIKSATREVQIFWEFATEWHRSNAVLISLCTTLGLSESQVDDLFSIAKGL